MNIQPDLRMGKSEFLAWVQAREGRYELAGSRVVMMTGGSRGHALIVRQLARALEKRLDSGRWAVLTSDFGVDVGPSTVRYPDVVVDAAGGALRDLTATAPVLIAEVISPSSEKDDLGDKAEEYLRLPDLSAYLVLAQDEPKIRVWLRGPRGFARKPNVVKGLSAVVDIAPLGAAVPLQEIYLGFPDS
jgi:Uma2 family endonuclease